jgi:YjjG family noncanonical pyrimidine nucleotidase
MKIAVQDIFFDLDHTLWDFERNSELAFAEVFKKNSIEANLNQFLNFYNPINTKYWELYRNGEISQPELRYRRLKDSFDAISLDLADEVINLLSEDYIYFLPKFNNLIDYAREILHYLSTKYNLHIITNGFSGVQNSKMQHADILCFFKTITDSETAGVKKPHPAIFEYALNQAQAQAQFSVMIGDCIEADVRGALNAGMHAILYQKEPQFDSTVLQISHLEQLQKYL